MKRPTTVLLCAAACALLTPAWAVADDDDDDNGETTVTCGQVITKSIKLANDLHNCPGTGLEVGKKNITIDLNGHTVDGLGVNIGIDNSPGGTDANAYRKVTIKNGTVTQFRFGISIAFADRNRVDRIGAISNDAVGIGAAGTDRLRITNSTVTNTAGQGIELIGDAPTDRNTNARIERNAVLNNVIGIAVGNFNTNTLLKRNSVVNNTADGILVLSSATATRIDNNDANGNGDDGIDVDATDAATVIKRNRARNNSDLGIEAAAGVTDGGGNRASGNGNALQCTGVTCTP